MNKVLKIKNKKSKIKDQFCNYFARILNDFGRIYRKAVDDKSTQEEISKLVFEKINF